MSEQTPWSSDQASIDPTFNLIRPRGVVLQRDLPTLSGMGPWPRSMLQPFMHEVTHHWCFRGAVGNTLAAMNLRSCETAVFGGGPEEFARGVGDHLDFRAIMEFLRPLAEGMALFAEFDSRPGRASVISDAQHFALIACATGAMNTQEEASAAVDAALRAVRTSRDGITRKLGVLKHPGADVGSAYFNGYLMVKSLHRELRRQFPQAEDADWFLVYLRDYIFHDPGLVNRLLNNPPQGRSKIDVVIRYVGERLWTLMRMTELEAREHDAHCNRDSPPTSGPSWPAGIGTPIGEDERATALIDEFLRWHTEDCSEERVVWRAAVGSLLAQRNIAVVAAEEVPLRVHGGVIETSFASPSGDVTLFKTGHLDASAADRDTIGWVAVFLRLGREPFIATALGDDTSVLAARVRPAVNEHMVLEVLTDRTFTPPAFAELKGLTEEAHRKVRVALESSFGKSNIESHARQEAKRLAAVFVDMLSEDWMYGWESQPESTAPRGRPSTIFEKIGLWALFAPDGKMLKLYVRASLGAKLKAVQRKELLAFSKVVEERFGIGLIEQEGAKLRFLI